MKRSKVFDGQVGVRQPAAEGKHPVGDLCRQRGVGDSCSGVRVRTLRNGVHE